MFPVKDVPELPRGKGNKLFDIPSKKFASREDFLTGMAVVAKDKSLVVRSGDRKMTHRVEGPQGLPRPARTTRLGAAARLAHGRFARGRVTSAPRR